LLRGHNAPGGGFIAGLLAASALALYLLAYGVDALLRLVMWHPLRWAAFGLLLMLASGLWGLLGAAAFLQSVWPQGVLALVESRLLFDAGVYLSVCFAVMTLLLSLEMSQ